MIIILKNTETTIEELIGSVVVVFQFGDTEGDKREIQDIVFKVGIDHLILGRVAINSNLQALARENGLNKLDANNVLEFLLTRKGGAETLAVGSGIKVNRKVVSVLLIVSEPVSVGRV
jgi:hypothetical protein